MIFGRRVRFALVILASQILLIALGITWVIQMTLIAMKGSVIFVEYNRTVLPTWRDFFQALQRGMGKKQRLYVPVFAARIAARIAGAVEAVFPRVESPINYYRVRRVTTETTYDIAKTIAELGYEPDDDFERQFAEIVAWYRKEKACGWLA